MNPVTQAAPSSRWFSSDDVPERERLTVLNEAFAASASPCELVPTGEDRLYVAGYAITLPGAFITHGASRGIEYRRLSRAGIAGDALMLTITLSGHYRVACRGREFLVRPGEGWVALPDQLATANHVSGQARRSLAVMLPPDVVADARLAPDAYLRGPIRCDNTAMRLLVSYTGGLESAPDGIPPVIARRAAEHVADLVLLALDAGGDAAEQARIRGLPATRLHQLKHDIRQCVDRGQPLTLPALAARHAISPVYVQKLFERDGTSFSNYVLERRLEHVHRRLRNPRFWHRSISALVYDAGFNNLSWFNRAFRRRYGATPTEIRHEH